MNEFSPNPPTSPPPAHASASGTSPLVAIGCVAAVGVSLLWAFGLPLPRRSPQVPEDTSPLASPPTVRPGFDVLAFRAPLWVAPPAPHPAPREDPKPALPPKPQPLRLELIAVVSAPAAADGPAGGAVAGQRAFLYDPDTDRLLDLAEGEQGAGCTVESITSAGVRVRHPGGVQTLTLEQRAAGTDAVEKILSPRNGGGRPSE